MTASRHGRGGWLWTLIALPLVVGAQVPAPRADRIFVNGKIWTADDARPSAEALAISVEAALRHYTRDGAYANFDEQKRGSLTPGKLADLVVLSKDILTVPPEDILKTKVMLTVMGGKDTYRNEDFH